MLKSSITTFLRTFVFWAIAFHRNFLLCPVIIATAFVFVSWNLHKHFALSVEPWLLSEPAYLLYLARHVFIEQLINAHILPQWKDNKNQSTTLLRTQYSCEGKFYETNHIHDTRWRWNFYNIVSNAIPSALYFNFYFRSTFKWHAGVECEVERAGVSRLTMLEKYFLLVAASCDPLPQSHTIQKGYLFYYSKMIMKYPKRGRRWA